MVCDSALSNADYLSELISLLLENPNPQPPPGCTSESGEFKSPNSCTSTGEDFDCNYYVAWSFDEATDSIDFVLKVKRKYWK